MQKGQSRLAKAADRQWVEAGMSTHNASQPDADNQHVAWVERFLVKPDITMIQGTPYPNWNEMNSTECSKFLLNLTYRSKPNNWIV